MKNTVDILVLGLESVIATGLSFNTNILDTNLINLAVVIGVLVYFGKGVLQNILNNRRDNIVTQIQDAKQNYELVKQDLLKAQEELLQAKAKEKQIRANGELEKKRQEQLLIDAHEENVKRLINGKHITIQLAEQKATEYLRHQLLTLAFKEAEKFLQNNITSDMHTRINDYQLGILKLVQPVK